MFRNTLGLVSLLLFTIASAQADSWRSSAAQDSDYLRAQTVWEVQGELFVGTIAQQNSISQVTVNFSTGTVIRTFESAYTVARSEYLIDPVPASNGHDWPPLSSNVVAKSRSCEGEMGMIDAAFRALDQAIASDNPTQIALAKAMLHHAIDLWVECMIK